MAASNRVVLALDPGKRHFAFCVIVGASLKRVGMIHNTINDIDAAHALPQREAFVAELDSVLDRYEPQILVIERMQQRPGMGGGAPAEYINIMIGVVLEHCTAKGIEFRGVTAATWKNALKRAYDPKPDRATLPKGTRIKALPNSERMGFDVPKSSKTLPILDHEFDAVGIGMWFIEQEDNASYIERFKKQLKTLWEIRRAKNEAAKAEKRAASKAARKRKPAKAAAPKKPVVRRSR